MTAAFDSSAFRQVCIRVGDGEPSRSVKPMPLGAEEVQIFSDAPEIVVHLFRGLVAQVIRETHNLETRVQIPHPQPRVTSSNGEDASLSKRTMRVKIPS